MGAHRAGELVAQLGLGGVSGHVDGLAPGVGGRVGRAGVVSAENLHHTLALEVLGEPDETGAEHGVGGGQEVELEGLDGRASVDDVPGELLGDLGALGGLHGVRFQDRPNVRVVLLTRQLKKKWLL